MTIEPTTDSVLHRLNQWYGERMETHYSENIGRYLQNRFARHIRNEEGLMAIMVSMQTNLFVTLSRNAQVRMAKQYFTEVYKNTVLKQTDFDSPCLESIVDRMKQKPPYSWDKGQVDGAFLESFDGYAGFTEFRKEYWQTISDGALERVFDDSALRKKVAGLIEQTIPWVDEIVFADLPPFRIDDKRAAS